MSPRPSLTVALAVWDHYVAYLPVALEEAARQGVPAKLLILDNASEVPVPGASELRSMLGAEQRDVLDISVWRSQRRLTIGAARQAQVDQTETAHIVFHDADDLLLPGVWGFLLERLERRPELACAAARNLKATVDGVWYSQPTPGKLRLGRHARWSMFWANLFGNVLTPGPAAIHRTDAIRAIGGFPDLDVLEDFVIGACLPLAGPVEWHDRWGRLWVIRDGSLWFRDQPVADLLEAKEQAIERIRSLDTPWHVRAALPFMARRLRRETLRIGDIRPGASVPPAELIVRLPADVDFSLRERLTRAESLRRC